MNPTQKLSELVRDIETAMLTTQDAEGHLRSRPMAIAQKEWDGNIWFFTGAHSPKIDEIADDEHVNVSFSDPKASRYVSVSGTATLSRDKDKMKELWTPMLKAWFPKGLEDPEISLLKVTIDSGEYWDAPTGRMIQFLGIVKSALKGEKYDGAGSDHAKVELNK